MEKTALFKKRTFLQVCSMLFIFSLCTFARSYGQTGQISGKVTNEKNEPLADATVTIMESNNSTAVASDGTYSFRNLPDGSYTLSFSFVGYNTVDSTVTISSGGSQTLDVSLLPMAQDIDEVVVIGYGAVRKKDLTGSVVSLQSKDFNKGITTAPDQLIQGKTPGVMVINNTGQPGGATTVRIRGNSSIRAGNNPLFVLDGIPLSGTSARPGGFGGTGSDKGNPLTYLNPNDIASMDILKDASATAIYGSRGANGVVIINTKKGATGEPRLEVNASTGFSKIARTLDILSANEFREATKIYTPDEADNVDFKSNVNAMDAITQTGVSQNYYAAATGGSDRGKYRISAGYFDQKGIIKTSGLKKLTAGLNSSFRFLENKRLGVDFNLLFTQTNEKIAPIDVGVGFEGNIISQAMQWNPTRPLYDNDGNYSFFSPNYRNPLASLDAYNDRAVVNTIVANVAPSYKITDFLEYKLMYSFIRQTGERNAMFRSELLDPSKTVDGIGYNANNQETNQQVTNTLSFNKDISDGLNLNAVLGHEYLKYQSSWNNSQGTGFDFLGLDYYDYMNYSIASSRLINSYRYPDDELQSFFLRAAFNYQDRYLFTGTVRRDGSTKFGENNKYANFPSLAVAWNISNESFLKGNTTINNLKLRLGWGKTGNREFPSGASRNRYVFDMQSYSQTNYGNPDLKWETSSTLNAGLDFAFFNNRFFGSVDYFNKTSKDVLFERNIAQPAPSGKIWVNLDGEVVNKGVELALGGVLIENRDMSWTVNANATFLKNSVSGLPGFYETATLRGQGFSGVVGQRMVSGQPLNVWYLAIFEGIDPATGLSKYRALDGTVGTDVDPAQNKFYVNSPNPKQLVGFSTEFNYKKFTATINMNGAMGHYLFNNTYATVLGINNLSGKNIARDFYKPELKEQVSNSAAPSTRYLEKGDYLKLSNATLSYRIGDIGNVIRNLNISLTGQNLFVITGYKGFDPEVNTDGSSNGIPSLGIEYIPYPPARSFLIGVNFSL